MEVFIWTHQNPDDNNYLCKLERWLIVRMLGTYFKWSECVYSVFSDALISMYDIFIVCASRYECIYLLNFTIFFFCGWVCFFYDFNESMQGWLIWWFFSFWFIFELTIHDFSVDSNQSFYKVIKHFKKFEMGMIQ